MMKNKLSCIIPFYNESKQLIDILNTINRIPEIDQIICVDDGSAKKLLSEEIRNNFPHVNLCVLEKNGGKSAAVRHGLSLSKGEIILLMDADLVGINETELVNAIELIQNTPLDMIILRRVKASWLVRLIRGDVLLSGERLLKKTDLENIFKLKVSAYQLEMAINKYMKLNRKRVIWMPHTAKNTYKFVKSGLLTGIWMDLKMYANILSYIGLYTFLIHLFSFCKENDKKYFSR